MQLVKQAIKQTQREVVSETPLKEIERRTEEVLKQVDARERELQKVIQEIRKKLDYLNRYLKIDIDDQLEIPVVKIFERDTNRLIRQIPPDHLLELMRRIDEMLGVLLSERV
ncbi:MAG TPA: flagellar biosynthesis protein FlaG [Aquificaceae bacterium]|nr:flagellar biosynthesis protein FlaG [Aquificaceae bacterium]